MKASRPYHRHAAREILDALQGEGTPKERIEKAQVANRYWGQRLDRVYRPSGKTAEGLEEWYEVSVALGINKGISSDGTMWYSVPGLEHGAFIPAEEALSYLVRSAEECLGLKPRGARERWLESVRFGVECVVKRCVASGNKPLAVQQIHGITRSSSVSESYSKEYAEMAKDFITRLEAGEYDVTP